MGLGVSDGSRKIRVHLTLNLEIVEEARKLGLNTSKICENALKEAVMKLKIPYAAYRTP